MREIKFRGRRLGNGEWLYGSLLVSHFKDDKKERYFITQFSGNYTFEHEVDPATVGQFTGLKDKSGREIWEDDVMRFITEFGETMTSEVAFMNGFFYVQGEDDDDIYGITYAVESMNAEIIGNIHDTPELLKTE